MTSSIQKLLRQAWPASGRHSDAASRRYLAGAEILLPVSGGRGMAADAADPIAARVLVDRKLLAYATNGRHTI